MNEKPNLIARLLGSGSTSPPASSEVRRALEDLKARRRQVDQRLRAIAFGYDGNPTPPPERQRVLATGTPEDLVQLDVEVDRLRAEVVQLDHREKLLLDKLAKAEAEEAKATLPALRKALPDQCETLENARAELRRAEEKFKADVAKYTEAVRAAEFEPDYGLQDLAGRIVDLLGFPESEKRGVFSSARNTWFIRLGAGLTPRAARSLGKDHPANRPDTEDPDEDPDLAQFRRDGESSEPSNRGFLKRGGALRRQDAP